MKIHKAKKDYLCEMCDKQFINLSRLNYHIQNVHGEPAFHCDQCTKVFRSKVNFNRHLRIHTKEKPFQCPECAFSSNNSANLTSHVRSVHKQPDYTPGKEDKAKKKTLLVKNILKNKTSRSIRSLLGSPRTDSSDIPATLGANLFKEMTDKGELAPNLLIGNHVSEATTNTSEAIKAVPQTLLKPLSKPVSFLKPINNEKIITVRNREGLLVNAVVKVKKGKSNGDQILHVCVKK